MTLYEVFDNVSKALSLEPEDQARIATYIRDSADDNIEFVRSRYCKRQEGPLPNRELGPIQYIVCGSTKPFEIKQIRYILSPASSQSTDFQFQIIWGKNIDSIEEDKEFCEELEFEYTTDIFIES